MWLVEVLLPLAARGIVSFRLRALRPRIGIAQGCGANRQDPDSPISCGTSMSAFPSIADLQQSESYVRFVRIGDILPRAERTCSAQPLTTGLRQIQTSTNSIFAQA